MDIQLDRVQPSERKILYRLLQYSLYEESAQDGNEIGNDALFAYPHFDAYFTAPDWEAYLFRERECKKLFGFAMLRPDFQASPSGHCIEEFMILPQYRRKGAGRTAALACLETHTGTWTVSPSHGSQSAYCF